MQAVPVDHKNKVRVAQYGRDLVIARCIIDRPVSAAQFRAIGELFTKTDPSSRRQVPLLSDDVEAILLDGHDDISLVVENLPKGEWCELVRSAPLFHRVQASSRDRALGVPADACNAVMYGTPVMADSAEALSAEPDDSEESFGLEPNADDFATSFVPSKPRAQTGKGTSYVRVKDVEASFPAGFLEHCWKIMCLYCSGFVTRCLCAMLPSHRCTSAWLSWWTWLCVCRTSAQFAALRPASRVGKVIANSISESAVNTTGRDNP